MLWLMRDGPETRPESEFPAAAAAASGVRWSVGEALTRCNFRRLAGSYFACGFSMSMVQTHFPAHALHAGMPQIAAATAFGMMGIWAIAGTVSAGAISDRYGRKRLLSLVYAVRMLALLLMAWAPNPLSLVVSSVLFGLAWTATGPLTSMLTAELFGIKNMGLLFGTVFFTHQLGATLGAYLGGALFDLSGSYTLPLLTAGAVLGAASLISYGINETTEKLDQITAPAAGTSSA
jgi:MFS family permease